jgi:regulator of replication initiation timing
MSELNRQLDQIKQDLKKLVHLYNALKVENQRLLSDNAGLHATLDDQAKKIEELENKNLTLQISKTVAGDKLNNAALKQKLNEFIKEIDDCLAHLKE